jgi:pimeloyl-ACP methyl ester carboxylesterase
VLVGHSYAGLVISKAAIERPDVQHLVYVAARLVDRGDVYLKRMSEFPAAPINDEVELTADGNFVVRVETAVRCFYNECARGEAEDAAPPAYGGRLRGRADRRRTVEADPVDLRAVRTRSRHPPRTFRDGCPLELEVVTLDTDHSPFMSSPEQFAELLDGIANKANASAGIT